MRISESVIQKLAWLPLSPDKIREELDFRSRVPHDFEIWNVDTRLAACFDEINAKAKRHGRAMFDQREFSKSMQDRKFTKRFYHLKPTLENMEHFLDPALERPSAVWRKNFKAARSLLNHALSGIPKLEPWKLESEDDCLRMWGNKSASVGFGGRGSKAKNVSYIFDAVNVLRSRIASGEDFDNIWIPAVVFHRAQISGYVKDGKYCPDYNEKDRLVMGFDGATVTLEGVYAKPLYEQLFKSWFNYSGGDDPDVMRGKIRKAAGNCAFWFQTDFSKFDQSIQSWLIGEAFDVIKGFFPPECQRELSWIAHNFIHTRILLPGGEIVQKHRGVPSGSYLTQLVGSMCNALMILTYLCSTVDGSVEDKVWRVKGMLSDSGDGMKFLVLGDDGITFLTRRISLEEMSAYLWKVFGVTISPDKSITSDQQKTPHYLKRDWRYDGEWRDPLELAIALVHPEYWRTYIGYGPWHIMYGLYLTYRAAFPQCITEDWILMKMEAEGGVDALAELDTRDLPGPLRGFGDKSLALMYLRAKALLRAA